MTYLIDTNVVSEWMSAAPAAHVLAWMSSLDEDASYVSVITIGELRFGVERKPPGRRRERLAEWVNENLRLRFEGRVLPVDVEVAETWGRMSAACAAKGHALPTADALIAATALAHGLTIVTRNVKDFAPTGVAIHNPWMN